MKIQKKLTFLFLAIASIPMVFVGFVSFTNAKNFLIQATINNLVDVADGKEAEILEFLGAIKTQAVDFSSDSFIRSEAERISEIKDELEKRQAGINLGNFLKTEKQLLDDSIGEINILDPEGIVIAATHEEDLGKKVSLAMPATNRVLAHIYDAELEHGKPFIKVAISLVGRDNKKLVGTLLVRYALSHIEEILSGEKALQLGAKTSADIEGTRGAYLVNRDGSLVLSYNKMEEIGFLEKRIETEPVIEGLKLKNEIAKKTIDYKGHVVLASSMCLQIEEDVPWVLVVEEDVSEAVAPIYSLGMLVFMLGCVTFLSTAVAAVATALSISRPIRALQKGAEMIGSGDLDYKVGTDVNDEIGQLSRAFDRMTDNLKKTTASRDELNKAKKMAEVATRVKSEFLSNMSSELRTPLNAVIGFTEVLRGQKLGSLNETQKEYLNDILGRGKHLLSLINDILDLSKVESGKIELIFSNFSLKELLEQSVTSIKEEALKHNVELFVDVAEEASYLRADERKVKQIVYNLLSNAVKFTPDGGKVGIRARRVGSEVEVSVWDTGIGISKEEQYKIFQEFVQIENPLTKGNEGAGLGLVLAKKLVELHKGKIRVESDGVGNGAIFIITLPIKSEI